MIIDFKNFTTYSITRAQLLADGSLRDITAAAREAGHRIPVAITRAAWEDCIAWTAKSTEQQKRKNENTRLWDVVWMCAFGLRMARPSAGMFTTFDLIRQPNGGRTMEGIETTLKAIVTAGDAGEPVLTILMLHED